jgi:leucyl aminopeptidase
MVAVAVPSGKTQRNKALSALEAVMGKGSIKPFVADERFEGKDSQALKIVARGPVKARWLLLVGVGRTTDPKELATRLAHALVKAACAHKSGAVALTEITEEAVRAAAQALVAAQYRFARFKTDDKSAHGLDSVEILNTSGNATGLTKAVHAGQALGESINFARDLVNRPPNDLTPITLAQAASSEARKLKLPCQVFTKARIEKEGMNLLLAVSKGSAVEPRVIHVTYRPSSPRKKIVFVGKGLTFDAGGLCLKPAKSMVDMKCDMAGAAVTLAVVFAAARLKLPVEVHAVVGSTENMTGAAAYRPGDVYTSLEGKTVEIINTDAEGRLVLADVLTWSARKLKPDIMIDHATLTGACMVALGPYRAALYAADDKLARKYLDAADEAAESFWQMPLDKQLRPSLRSPVADLKHVGGAYGGSITAALFLQEFVCDVPWMHLDIAGPAFLERPHHTMPKGGTGFGVATAVRFLEGLGAAKAKKKA